MIKRRSKESLGRPFRNLVFIKLLLSFLCILLIPVVIGALLYKTMEQALINNANSSNQALLEQVRLSIDSRINEVDQLAVQVGLNPTLQLLLFNEPNIDEYTYIELIKGLKRYRNLSPFVDDYYVYLKESGHVVTTSIKTDSFNFYNYIHNYLLRDEGQIVQMLSRYHLKTYLPSEPIQYSLKQRNMITFVKSLPIGESVDIKGSIVIMIDESEILGLLRKTDERNSDLYILNEQQEVLSTTAADSEVIDGILPRLTDLYGDFLIDIGGKSMMVSFTKSSQNNWTYISILPTEVVLSKVKETKSLALLFLLVCVIAGITGSYYLAYKNYNPVRELIHAIRKGKNMPDTDIQNEFAFIKNELMISIDEEKNMRRLLSQQAPVIKSDFISRMIKGYVDTRTLTDEDFDFMGVQFANDCFGVIVVQIDDCRQFIQEDTEREWTLIRFILINLSNELLKNHGYAVDMERDRVGILVNLPSSSDQDLKELNGFLQQLQSHMEDKFRTSVTVAISSLEHGIGGIAEAYGEATMALEHKLLQGHSSVIYYNDIKHAKRHYFYYSMEMESQLINYAKSGDYASIVKTLEQIFEVNFQTRAISPEMGKCLFFELINTVLKLFNSLNMDETSFFDGESDPIKYIAKLGTVDKMQERLEQLYEAICKQVEGERTGHSDRLLQKIQDYIKENYASNDLSLGNIAEHCGINPSYLSSFFKKHYGQNLTEYITGLRIKLAKTYLEEGELTVTQIALKVGFANDIGFIRVFKKSEGITPGKYKENLLGSCSQKTKPS